MPTTGTLTTEPDTTRPDSPTETSPVPASPGNSDTQRDGIDGATARNESRSARVGVAFVTTAAIAVGALVWAVIASPADNAVDTSTYERVEANRATTLRELSTPSGYRTA